MKLFTKLVARRYLWSKQREAFISIITVISVLGVALGVMVLCIVMAVMTGFEVELREKIIGANAPITVQQIAGGLANHAALRKEIARVRSVREVDPYTYSQALLRTDRGQNGVLVRGLLNDSRGVRELAGQVEPVGSFSGWGSSDTLPPLLVGRELALTLGIQRGDKVAVMATELGSSPFGLIPRFRRFEVVGIYHSGLVEYESAVVYTDLAVAQQFFSMGGGVTGLEISVDNPVLAPAIAAQIRDALGDAGKGLLIRDWTELNRPLWQALKLEKRVYFIVLVLLVIMASFSIVSTLVMVVLEKRKDIAVLRTIGASAADIASIFRFQGMVIGLLGTGLGLVLGVVGCLALRQYGFPLDDRIFPVSTLPIHMEFLNFAAVGIVAVIICFVATLYPARRASALKPVELLRYE